MFLNIVFMFDIFIIYVYNGYTNLKLSSKELMSQSYVGKLFLVIAALILHYRLPMNMVNNILFIYIYIYIPFDNVLDFPFLFKSKQIRVNEGKRAKYFIIVM